MKRKYDEIEIELVMDAYGVGRARAVAILREKAIQDSAREEAARKEAEEARARRRARLGLGPDGNKVATMTAAEFFGE